MLRQMQPLMREFLVAASAMTVLAVIVAVLYWLITGLSPWPGLILGEVAGFGFGTAILAIASPRWGGNNSPR